MRACNKIVASCLIAALGLYQSAFAEVRPTPDWGSDQIRAARHLSPVEALIIDYKIKTVGSDHATKLEQGSLTLAPDFTAIDNAEALTLDDFALCRQLVWSKAASNLSNLSCYVTPAFQILELKNRQRLAEAVPDLKTMNDGKPVDMSPYWPEAELAYQTEAVDRLKAVATATGTDWYLNNRIVASTHGSGTAFTREERPRVARYFSRHVSLHPQILQAILDAGQLPDEIVMEVHQGTTVATQTLNFANLRRQSTAYPLPANLVSNFLETARSPDEAAALNAEIQALKGKALPERLDYDGLLTLLTTEAKANHPLQVALLISEIYLQYGFMMRSRPDMSAKMQAILDTYPKIINADESAYLYLSAKIAVSKDSSSLKEKVAKYLAEATNLDGMRFGSVRYDMFATLIEGAGDTSQWDQAILTRMPSVTDCRWRHIAGYPWSSTNYAALGYTMLYQYDVVTAWNLFDMGRAIDPDWTQKGIRVVGENEATMRQVAPDKF